MTLHSDTLIGKPVVAVTHQRHRYNSDLNGPYCFRELVYEHSKDDQLALTFRPNPDVARWNIGKLKGDHPYSSPALLVRQIDSKGNMVRPVSVKRNHDGTTRIDYSSSPADLLLVFAYLDGDESELEPKLIRSAFVIMDDTIVSDEKNPLLGIEAYFRYNEAGYKTQDDLYAMFKRKTNQEINYKGRFSSVADVMQVFDDHVKEVYKKLLSVGAIGFGREDSLMKEDPELVAYEDVSEHFEEGLHLVGGIVCLGAHGWGVYEHGTQSVAIVTKDDFIKAVQLCGELNQKETADKKLCRYTIILFSKNHRGLFIAVPAIDEFNFACDLGFGLSIVADCEMFHPAYGGPLAMNGRYASKEQTYRQYNPKDFSITRTMRAPVGEKPNLEKDRLYFKSDNLEEVLKTPLEDKVRLFKQRVSRTGLWAPCHAEDTTTLPVSTFVETIGEEIIAKLMDDTETERITKLKEHRSNYRKNGWDDMTLMIKVKPATFVVQVRDFDVSKDKPVAPPKRETKPEIVEEIPVPA